MLNDKYEIPIDNTNIVHIYRTFSGDDLQYFSSFSKSFSQLLVKNAEYLQNRQILFHSTQRKIASGHSD